MIIKQRMDVLTRKKYNKKELIKIVVQKNSKTFLDYYQSERGRGIYFHVDSLEVLLEKNILKKIIKTKGGHFESILIDLNELLEKSKNG